MPELPEVETIRRQLSRMLVGKRVKDIEVRNQRSFLGESRKIIGSKIIGLTRRAKILIIKLDNNQFLVIHLKMTGQLVWQAKSQKPKVKSNKVDIVGGHPDKVYNQSLPHQYTRIIFAFDDGSQLYFNDLRKFGWLAVTNRPEKYIEHLGVEPLSPEFNIGKVQEIVAQNPRAKIKPLLMKQEVIAGIGNIYSDEILLAARILPTRSAGDLAPEEIRALFVAIPQILKKALKMGGTSRSDYLKPDGSKGGFMDYAMVYGRRGQPCKLCGATIKTLKLAGRTAHFCPVCQR